jgi:hypothetical protein
MVSDTEDHWKCVGYCGKVHYCFDSLTMMVSLRQYLKIDFHVKMC